MLNKIRCIYNFSISPDKTLARSIRRVTGISPYRLRLYKLAFLHKSLTVEDNKYKGNNERLEFLGDSILSTIVADYLYQKYPNNNEGFMTKMRSKIVKRKTLNLIADKMGLDVILSDYSTGKLSSAMLGNALEALIGAIYLDRGYAATKSYVINHILRNYVDIENLEAKDDNFKSILLEHCQKNNKLVEFSLLKKYKFNKRDRFRIAVMVQGKELGLAEDYNKKAAEQKASQQALGKIKNGEKQKSEIEPPATLEKAQ